MKFIIFGLGNFGASLAIKLTDQGHEVIGIDKKLERVNIYKEQVSHTICMDSTDEYTMEGLPLRDTDIFIVAIGEDQGASIMTTAILKNLKAKRIIARAITPLQENVLQAMGVSEIVYPEKESAERWSKKLCLKKVINSFEISGDFSIVEAEVPANFIGQKLEDLNLIRNHNVVILTTIKEKAEKNLLGQEKLTRKVQGVARPETMLEKGDKIVLYGANRDIDKVLGM
ncbi:MAG: TrkA family potassium uptake protein [Saprospiraceae bacterium]|nr:TrkA family potassium uptake protein [Saprospiraceae bacterium]